MNIQTKTTVLIISIVAPMAFWDKPSQKAYGSCEHINNRVGLYLGETSGYRSTHNYENCIEKKAPEISSSKERLVSNTQKDIVQIK